MVKREEPMTRRGRIVWIVPALLLLTACGEAAGGDGGSQSSPDAAPPPAEPVCDEVTHRAVIEGVDSFECPEEPAVVTIRDRYTFEIFKYEASHPLADADRAFPCAVSEGTAYEAPAVPTEACSRPGVRPWHSVRWEDARRACERVGEGWRLCDGEELARACGGPMGNAYTYGPQFEPGACNVLQSYIDPASEKPREAPTGAHEQCVSEEGVYDLTGNLWEWTGDRDNSDPNTHYYQGAGWQIIAERHRRSDQTCTTRTQTRGFVASTFANPFVGFRCCRTRRGD